ncbi:EAL domain-containing protein, partial [Vibrio cincinnatiensis]|uniref:EAL domain-containing protein n=1 Tax=Vibrio cincinnatiensis TaxID=675 RepID=UPI001EDED70F
GKDTQHELDQPLKKSAYVSNHRGPLLRLKNIINLAKDNNMKIVIEGIDTILQYAITSKYRNAYFQGKLLCKAMSLEYFKLQIFESNLQVI